MLSDHREGVRVTSKEIIKALRRLHPEDRWVFATEVETSTGATRSNYGGVGGMRRIDAFAMALWPSLKYARVAYEIKVGRADFLKELREPVKRAQAYYLCNRFFFAVAPGVVTQDDLRDTGIGWRLEYGILEVQEDGAAEILSRPLWHEAWPMPLDFTASFLRRVRQTGRIAHTTGE